MKRLRKLVLGSADANTLYLWGQRRAMYRHGCRTAKQHYPYRRGSLQGASNERIAFANAITGNSLPDSDALFADVVNYAEWCGIDLSEATQRCIRMMKGANENHYPPVPALH